VEERKEVRKDNQERRADAERLANLVADSLQELSDRIRVTACRFKLDGAPTASIVADIVNDYTQFGNSAGARFWNMIRDLEDAEWKK
jgi:hypothetical protein